ncbi:MAG: TlpA disulfide reductase family protein [Nitrospinae bacterium]|nr:TlpA disulfide reductase family protein [Nitrospinota bacterium]
MKMTARFKITLITTALLLSSMHPSVWAHQQAFENMGISKPRTEKSAPGFSLQDTKGNNVNLEDFSGKPILLNFWATWCEACKEELPSMQRLYEALSSQGVEVVAIAIDRQNFDRVKKYAEEYKLTFPVLWDPEQKVRKHYYIMGLPTTYLIGPHGKLRGFASGARVWDSPDSMQALISLKD